MSCMTGHAPSVKTKHPPIFHRAKTLRSAQVLDPIKIESTIHWPAHL